MVLLAAVSAVIGDSGTAGTSRRARPPAVSRHIVFSVHRRSRRYYK
ncbi:hypothetical protein ARZXY2_4383 (plasmid) [Arthrobacter sp. ZXY-2]|nr:hypothetical protein ARZXY2_4383 [Arthrobacter sp. ZXY-2]